MSVRTVDAAWRDALNRHDPHAAAACFSTDARYVDHGTGQRSRRRVEVRESTEEWLKAVSDLRIDEVSFVADGARYATQWIMSGRLTGDLPGLPATARLFTVPGSSHGEVRDGEIIAATRYWNIADLVEQVTG